jgi:hypothetical protein
MRPAVGFFKDLRKLNKMGKEAYLQMDVGAQMQQASAAMAQAQQMMAQQTAANSLGAPGNGEPASATITSVRNTGTLINYQPVAEIALLVQRDGRPPYPTTVTEQIGVDKQALCHPGRELQIKVDPEDPSTVWIDWRASAG